MAGRGAAGAVRRRLSRRAQPRLGRSARKKGADRAHPARRHRRRRLPVGPDREAHRRWRCRRQARLRHRAFQRRRHDHEPAVHARRPLCRRRCRDHELDRRPGVVLPAGPTGADPVHERHGRSPGPLQWREGDELVGRRWILVDAKDRAVLARQQRLRARRCLQHQPARSGSARRLDGDADLVDLPAGARRAALSRQRRRAPLSRAPPRRPHARASPTASSARRTTTSTGRRSSGSSSRNSSGPDLPGHAISTSSQKPIQ